MNYKLISKHSTCSRKVIRAETIGFLLFLCKKIDIVMKTLFDLKIFAVSNTYGIL